MNETHSDLVRAVQADLAVSRSAIERQLVGRTEPEFKIPDVRFVQAAQNTLRTCLEATLQQAGPWTDRLAIELAIRLASYAISALPIERQSAALKTVIRSLPEAHSARMRAGVVIKTEWETDGQVHDNIPKARA